MLTSSPTSSFDKNRANMIAGAVAGAVTATLCCSLDVSKTRIQAQGPPFLQT